jgi:hypothetical protein
MRAFSEPSSLIILIAGLYCQFKRARVVDGVRGRGGERREPESRTYERRQKRESRIVIGGVCGSNGKLTRIYVSLCERGGGGNDKEARSKRIYSILRTVESSSRNRERERERDTRTAVITQARRRKYESAEMEYNEAMASGAKGKSY